MPRAILDVSTGCLDYYKTEYDIRQIRLALYLGEDRYLDGEDIKADEFFKRLHDEPNLVPSTSQPSPGELLELFEGLIEEGYDEAFITTISSHLSGVYNGIVTVSKILEDKIKITIFDTKTVCFPEGKFAIEAAKMTKEGHTTEEIVKRLEEMRTKNRIYFGVDNLKYLVKNGRLSGAAGLVATMLKIKPLLEVQSDGRIVAVEKIRTTKKALERVAEKFVNDTANKDVEAYIVYTGNVELKEFLRKQLEERGIIGLIEVPCSPVVGCHVGPDAIGIGFFEK